jgi:Bacteriophage head to tail connecting protein
MPLSSDILAWKEQLDSQYANFFNTAQEVVDYMLPTHRGITTTDTPGTRKTERIFDSTAGDSLFLLCSFLAGSIFSQAFEWFSIKHPNEQLNKQEEVAQYFQTSKEVQLASFRQSNFYATAIELLTDWVTFGNMCVLQERLDLKFPNTSRLVFTPVGFGSYVFFEGLNKKPEGLFREVDMSAMECKRKFKDGCSEAINSAAEKKPFQMFRIVHAIVPRELIKYKSLATPKEMPWASLWFEHGKKQQKPLLESGYHEKPFAIARYNVIAGEVMGRGLGEIVLPSTKTLNRIIMRGFIDLDKGLDPPIDTTPGNIIGDYSHKAGSRNVMRSLNNTRTAESGLQARQRNATYEWNVVDLRTQIESILLSRQIRELTGIAGGPVEEKTAYQYSKELELLHLIMAPTGGRLQSEGLEDIVETNYAINYRLKTLPELPQALVEAAKNDQTNQTVIVYEGPLAQSQRAQQLGTMQEFLAGVGGLAGSFAPNVADIPDVDKFVRKEAEIRGIQYLLNDPKKTDEIRKYKAQIAQLQAQLQAAQQVADVAKSAAPMVTALQNGNQNGRAAA